VPDSDPGRPPAQTRRFTFRRRHRLAHVREFQAVHANRLRKSAGPLVVLARPNALAEPRLGLTVSRRVGPAVRRNRIKRLLREAFRLCRGDLPGADGGSYDLVVIVRPHAPLPLDRYRQLLATTADALDREQRRRDRRAGRTDGPEAPDDS